MTDISGCSHIVGSRGLKIWKGAYMADFSETYQEYRGAGYKKSGLFMTMPIFQIQNVQAWEPGSKNPANKGQCRFFRLQQKPGCKNPVKTENSRF